METEDLKDFALEKTEEYQSTLVILNTIPCAVEVFEKLQDSCSDEYEIYHLSNNMCPQNKLDILKDIKQALKDKKKKVICVSTQLVEAGVDFSFKCVIRSMAGLDNIIQAAGRCNRHRERDSGDVYIVKMSQKAENLSRNRDIRDAQTAMEEVLYQFNSHAEIFSDDLSSLEAVTYYYNRYYLKKVGVETNFPACVNGIQTTLVELLSNNLIGYNRYEAAHKNEPV